MTSRIYGFLVLITVLVGAIEAWSRGAAWSGHLAEGRAATENIAQAGAEQADATLNTIQGLLDGLVERVQTDGVNGAAGQRLRSYMVSRLDNHPALQGLFVYDRDGRALVSTRESGTPTTNRADRGYFAHHQANADKLAHLGPPIVSRTSGDWVITMSRRIDDGHGQFAGVVLATIPVRYFQHYYERFKVGKKGLVLLAFSDGTVVIRHPGGSGVVGSNIRHTRIFEQIERSGAGAGTVMLTTNFDHVERQYSFRRVALFPLVVSAALASDEIFAGWWRATWQECIVLFGLLAVVYAVGFWLIAEFRVRDRLEGVLRNVQAELEVRNADLARQARTDALTGLYNRRHFDEALDKELARAARAGACVSLIMIDVDFFKRYNDEYGHAGGDDCLRLVGAVIQGTVNRPGDVAARFGGEEFAVLLPGTPLEGALSVAESLRSAVAGCRKPHRGNTAQVVTISLGVASVYPRDMEAGRALVEEADRGLYEAKAAGRNCVRSDRVS